MGVGMFPTDDDDGVQLSFQLFRFQRLEMERLELVMGRTRGGGGGGTSTSKRWKGFRRDFFDEKWENVTNSGKIFLSIKIQSDPFFFCFNDAGSRSHATTRQHCRTVHDTYILTLAVKGEE